MKPILQVEDDPNDVFLLQHAMKQVGVTNPIQVASDGQQAIDYLKGAGKFANRNDFPLPCLVLLEEQTNESLLAGARCIRQQRSKSKLKGKY